MRLITKRLQIRTLLDRFRSQYRLELKYGLTAGLGFDLVGTVQALEALNLDAATEADIAKVLPKSWRSWIEVPHCDACGARTEPVIQVGQPKNFNSSTAVLCRICVEEAWSAIQGADCERQAQGGAQ